MEIRKINGARVSLQLSDKGMVGGNKFDILTGPNGSGKTEALVSLVKRFARPHALVGKSPDDRDLVRGEEIGHEFVNAPVRVIVQTFSPFTRFPAPAEMQERLLDIYERGDVRHESYACVGLHKSYRGVGRNLSRSILEDALFRISESPQAVAPIFGILRDLKFQPLIDLVYRARPAFSSVLNRVDAAYIEEHLAKMLRGESQARSAQRLRREMTVRSLEQISLTVADAIAVAQSVRESSVEVTRDITLPIRFDDIKRDFYKLQAFSLLRRLEILNLTGCLLFKEGNRKPLDVANASSGEQQMLCSVFGLVTAIRDNSLVLIDEPELSLHPKRQLEFVDSLMSTMSTVEQCHVIVCTHSPLVVQAAQSKGAAITQLGEGPAVSMSSVESEAISVEQALVDIFSTPVLNSSHVSNQIFKAIVQAETGDPGDQQSALEKLRSLQSLYMTQGEGSNTLGLVADAIRLINESDTGDLASEGRDEVS